MYQTFINQVRDGREYAKLWPLRRELSPLFAENRVIKASEFAYKVLPPLALFSLFVQLQGFGMDYFPQALASSLLFISIPVQGFLWLGKRARTPLPPSMAAWYRELCEKMAKNGYQVQSCRAKPRYIELATLLKDLFEKMDAAFRREIF